MSGVSLALSTMYFQRWENQHDLEPFATDAYEMGFRAIELSHILSPRALASLDRSTVRVSAVHHPCPRSDGPDVQASLVAHDSATRSRALLGIRTSIDTAASFGAPAVVLHLGQMEDDERETCRRLRFQLLSRYAAGQQDTMAYDAVRLELLDWLRAQQGQHLERAVPALGELVAYASERAVVVALETGYHPHELPQPDGMAYLLACVPGLGAWLDTGHVGAQENLGLEGFRSWFGAVGDRWTGAHFHDIVRLRDHLMPGMGTLDFGHIAGHLSPAVVKTLEVDWYFDESEVISGRKVLESALTAAWCDPT